MLCIEAKIEYDSDGSSIEKTFLQKRCDFFQRYQQSHETIYTYLEVVRSLAECCNFYKTEEELLIRDRLVSGLNDKDLQLSVLKTYENPTTDDILSLFSNEIEPNKSKVENLVNINHFTSSNDIEEYDTYKDDDEGDTADITIKEQLEHALDDHVKVEEPGSAKNPTDTNKGLTSLFKRHGWAYPKCSLDTKIHALECYLCKKQYKSVATLKKHIYLHFLPKKYLCPQCGQSFRFRHDIQRHLMRADHNGIDNRKFQCEICQKKFCDKSKFFNHRVVHTKERPFKCTYENCDKSYSTLGSLREHNRLHTGERPYHCNFCEYKFINTNNLKRHMLVHTAIEKNNICKGDDEGDTADITIKEQLEHALDGHAKVKEPGQIKNSADSNKGLTNLFKRHGWAYPKCSICGESFDDFQYLKGHLVEHTINSSPNNTSQALKANESTPPNCVLCNRQAETYRDLILHYAVHSSQNAATLPKVSCSICGKINAIGYLLRHMHLHIEATENYPCTLCDKEFKSKYKLARHMDIHKEHGTHFCELCGKKFLRKIYLETHKMKTHPTLDTKIHALECYLCKHQYKSVATLKKHIYLHFLPKNYLCTQCGQSFRFRHDLQRHLMRADHNGIDNRKFQCEICLKKFCDKSKFFNHRVVHTKERPFKCTYENCDKSYSTLSSLREHNRVHTGERPYHCNFCEYKSINTNNLKRHMLVHTGRHK